MQPPSSADNHPDTAPIQIQLQSETGDGGPTTRLHPSSGLLEVAPDTSWPKIRGYDLLSVIGSGGMGIVYKARHRELGRLVAIKTLRGIALTDTEFRKRFQAEAEAVAKLQHPNIVQLFEIGAVDLLPGEVHASPFISFEFVDGGSLARRTEAPQSPQFAARIVEKVARAAQVAHRLGVVHRDLKPANVLLTQEGEPKIADFGVAKQLDERDTAGKFVTLAGMVMGTPEYMAPEQAAGEPPTPAMDIYALGVILYELLTGRVPFQGATPGDTMYLIRHEEPVSPRRLQPTLPRDLETICMKCLEKSPNKRYHSADDLAIDLACWREGRPIHARPTSMLERTARWARRNPAVAMLSIAVVLVALAGVSGIVWGWQQAKQSEREALASAQKARASAHAERWERYRSNIVAASNALQSNNVTAARQALEASPEEHRDWEWQHFYRQTDLAKFVLTWPDTVVPSLNITPDARWIAMLSSGKEGTRVWDVSNRKEVRTFPEITDLETERISPDGKVFVGLRPDHSLAIRNITNDETLIARGHEGKINNIAFTPDGKRAMTLSEDQTYRVWDLAKGTELLKVTGEELLGNANFSEDGTLLATFGKSGMHVVLWNALTGRKIATLPEFKHHVRGAEFNRTGTRLLTSEGFPNNSVRLWDVATGKHLATLGRHENQVTATVFSPDDRRIVTTSLDQTAKLWDGETGQLIATLRGHKGWVHEARFSPDSKRLVTASQDHSARLWDAENGTPLTVLQGHLGNVFVARYTPDGVSIVTASRDGTIRVWDAQQVERKGIITGHTSFVYGVAFHPDGALVASAAWDGTARVWDVATGQQKLLLDHGAKAIVSSVAFHPGGRLIGTVSRDDTVRLWEVSSGKEVHRWSAPTDTWRETRLSFNPDGNLLAAGGKEGTVRIWDVNSKAEYAVLKGGDKPVRDVAFSPDGKLLASVADTGDHVVRIWDVAKKQQLRVLEGHTDGLSAVAFHPDGKLLASGSQDGSVRLWGTTTWKEVAELKHGANVYDIAFTPKGTRLASACADNTIRLWDVSSHQEVAELRGHTQYVHSLAFSPDGTRLVSGSGDLTVRIWESGERK